MEKTDVIIVGAGPSGLAIALSLARFKIHSVILEKDLEITKDPRGVYLAHDAVRILWNLGLGDSMADIGHEPSKINFHKTSFVNEPFHVAEFVHDVFWQTVPNAILHIQPRLEHAMRQKILESPFCELRCGCTVVGKQQDGEDPIINYTDENGISQVLVGSFVVGADGKRGVVRKEFLEQSAGIRQVDDSYKYDGTWVAANLRIRLPTPETHPDFPLWELGLSPEAVYDLFWPKGWHFCTPPGKPTAAGRFGPHQERMWRHEFAQEDWDDSMDSEKLLWEHITPQVTRKGESPDKMFPHGKVTYPRDCIEILRCCPYRFTHKVVNKWFDDRIVLIGDAAHVFPPFGGQGIACGLRDAHQLAWRISLACRLPECGTSRREVLLESWASERYQGVKDAAALTSLHGELCNQGDSIFFWLLRKLSGFLKYIPFIPSSENPMITSEARGHKSVKGGFFLAEHGGGGRLAQIYVKSKSQPPMLSDELIRRTETILTLIVLVRGEYKEKLAEAQAAIREAKLDTSIISEHSIQLVLLDEVSSDGNDEVEAYYPMSTNRLAELGISAKPGYSISNYIDRLGVSTTFAIARPDFYIFSSSRNRTELAECLSQLQRQLE